MTQLCPRPAQSMLFVLASVHNQYFAADSLHGNHGSVKQPFCIDEIKIGSYIDNNTSCSSEVIYIY